MKNGMTVAELIAHLQTLDHDRGIWVFYDGGCSIFPPMPDRQADVDDKSDRYGVKVGDYIISAG